MGELKSLRIERKLTQNQAADILGVSLRSYKSYENDEKKADSIKYKYMIEKISENAKKLSDEYKLHRGNVPWNAIYGLRNRIVHDYGNVDRKRHR